MKTKLFLALLAAVFGFALSTRSAEPIESTPVEATANAPIFTNYSDIKWNKILPDLGENSPEICILHVEPKTQATQLIIRTPKAIHIRKHWHPANESHAIIIGTASFACDGGKRMEF